VTLIASTSQVTVGAISIMLQANPDNVGLTPRTAEQYVWHHLSSPNCIRPHFYHSRVQPCNTCRL